MTPKKRKGYLRGDFGGQLGADSADTLKLISASEWAERITVGDNSRGERGANAAKRLDFCGAGYVKVDDRGDDRLGVNIQSGRSGRGAGGLVNRAARLLPTLSLSFRFTASGRIDGLNLRLQGAPRGGVNGRRTAQHRRAPCGRTERYDRAKK